MVGEYRFIKIEPIMDDMLRELIPITCTKLTA